MLPQTSSPTRRILSVQVCRGLAAMAVVLAHLASVERKYFTTHWTGLFGFGIGGVDLFFVISGVVISAVTAGKFGQTREAVKFLYHRVARIYPVYWVYSLVVLAAYAYHPGWINAEAGSQVEVVRSFLLAPSRFPLLLMQGWTLSFEMYFYMVFFALLLWSSERWAPWLLAAWAAGAVTLFALTPSPHGPISKWLMSPLLFEFVAGCVIYRVYRRSALHPAAGAALVAAALLWLAGVMVWAQTHGGVAWINDAPVARPALFGPFAALFVMGAMEMERSGLVRFARPLIAVGDWSYSIYLSHVIVIELVGRGVHRFVPGIRFAIVWVDVVALPLVLLVGYLSYTWLEVPLMRALYKRAPATGALRSAEA